MDLLAQILPQVRKPARYTGGEWNIIRKEPGPDLVQMVFAFPDVYEVGMSHLGLQILYHVVNNQPGALLERVFAPWPDMEEKMREHQLPLFSLESQRPLRDFDVIGFTLQYELSYTNILNMLDLAAIPLNAARRGEEYPLIIAGGPCAYNPEPLADFIDLFLIGEGEEAIVDFLNLCQEKKNHRWSKSEFLSQAAHLPGFYVPSLYHVTYRADGALERVTPVRSELPAQIAKRVVRDLDQAAYPTKPLVPSTEIIHDRIMLEVFRGCTRGCRFCQAGVLYRPVREKEPETVLGHAAEILQQTGYDEISLTSLSTSDYTPVRQVIQALLATYGSCGVGVSLPSLRADNFSVELAQEVQKVRRSGLTLAPEAGTQRLRDVINKGVREADLFGAVSLAFREGWHGLKLYFMIGLPTETQADLEGIARLAKETLALGKKTVTARNRLRVTISASSFVPKAHTPFQWEPFAALSVLKEKQFYLASALRERGLTFNYHDPEVSFLEAVFARGDRRLGPVLAMAHHLGCKFDGWSEHFNFLKWLEAFRLADVSPEWYAHRRFAYTDPLPWDHLNPGVSKEFLREEHQRALAGVTTPDCRTGVCAGCGLCPELGLAPRYAGGEL